MEAIAKMIRLVLILLVIGVLIVLFGLPIAIAHHAGASAALIVEIVVGEAIVLGILAYVLLAMFAKGMSR